jgi:hypothetical protein
MTGSANHFETKPLIAEKDTVTIRMYRSGFGDCFLLAFPAKRRKNKTAYLLIDCGVHHNYSDKKKLMEKVAAHIKASTGGKIDVVAVTHEHTDHILGFNIANAVFSKMNIDRVWMGWTENYADPEVKKLDKKKALYLKGLQAAAKVVGLHDPDFARQLEGVLGFYDQPVFGAGSKRMFNRDTMQWLQEKAKKGPTFCVPGEKPLGMAGVEDVRFFILGPPTDEKLLRKSSPSRGRKKETYLTDGPTELFDAFVESLLSIQALDDAGTRSLPGVGSEKQAAMTPFPAHYGVKPPKPDSRGSQVRDGRSISSDLYYDPDSAWRTIDSEWMDLAEELAIKLDSHTNNSSLVLALELGEDGKVLLFPGDAQVGNWLSWQELEWDLEGRKVTADDLLARTVLYKVGHHGSHNATLKAQGLEKMTSPELAAMIPVDGRFADEKQGWDIPYGELLEALMGKCRRRVLRSDSKSAGPLTRPEGLSQALWKEFLERVDDRVDYIDYKVKWK